MVMKINKVKPNEPAFWLIIEEVRVKCDNPTDISQLVCEITEILTQKSKYEIFSFELTFRDLIKKSNKYNIIEALKICTGYVSDDGYLYFRAGLTTFGKNVFYGTLKNPDAFAKELLGNKGGEEMLYVAFNAIENHTEYDPTEPSPYDLGDNFYSYGFNEEEPKGKNYKEQELPQKYPNLWKLANK